MQPAKHSNVLRSVESQLKGIHFYTLNSVDFKEESPVDFFSSA